MKLKLLLSLLLLFVATASSAYDFEVDGIFYNINGNNVAVASSPYSNKYSGDVIIPETVSYDSVTYAVTAIDNEAFWGCSNMTSITIPNSVISIGNETFRECDGLQDVTIPSSVTSIGNGAFSWCRGLTSVTIPSNVTSIGINPFWGSSSITSITVENGNPNYDSRDNCNAIIETSTNTLITGCLNTVIPDSITVISYFAFSCCSGLTSVNIPNTVTSIQYRAFHGCDDLLSVTLPNSVIFIGELAFNDCSSLETLSIPNSVTTIGDRAFWGCYGLKDVYSYIRNLDNVSIGKSVFESYSGDYPSRRTLHVPYGTADSYQADENWAPYFGQIVEDLVPEDCPRGDVNYDGEVNIADVNALHDIILQDSGYTPAADVNGDHEVTIADVNALIDIILNTVVVEEHEWVDLGLPSGTLWATCNIGANSPEEYGDYFAWGETEPKDYYSWDTYKWCKGSDDSFTKYCTSSEYGTVDGKTVLDPQDDAAFVNWGRGWRMPTEAQIYELRSYCRSTRIEVNGVKGRLITGRNGNSIFLPGSGDWNNGGGAGGYSGNYWSCSGQNSYAFGLWTDSGGNSWGYFNGFRYAGHTIRPVRGASTDFYIVEQSLDLGIEHVGELHTGHVTIVNNTMEEMTFSATVDEPFLLQQGEDFVSSMDIVVPGGSTTPLTVAFNGTASGQYNGNVTIKSAVPDGGETVIPVKIIAYADVSAEQEYLDMGLPSGTLWATCNLGASSPEQYGDHFAWGETEPKEVYNWETYKWCKGSENTLTKYCTSSEYGTVDGKTELEPEDDAAFVNLGPEWCMPTDAQIWELEMNCTWRWTMVNGVYGELVIGSNGNTLFFPLTGEMCDSTLENLDWYGYYWTRELSKYGSADSAAGMGFNYGSQWVGGFGTWRCHGCAVRAVRVAQN